MSYTREAAGHAGEHEEVHRHNRDEQHEVDATQYSPHEQHEVDTEQVNMRKSTGRFRATAHATHPEQKMPKSALQ